MKSAIKHSFYTTLYTIHYIHYIHKLYGVWSDSIKPEFMYQINSITLRHNYIEYVQTHSCISSHIYIHSIASVTRGQLLESHADITVFQHTELHMCIKFCKMVRKKPKFTIDKHLVGFLKKLCMSESLNFPGDTKNILYPTLHILLVLNGMDVRSITINSRLMWYF